MIKFAPHSLGLVIAASAILAGPSTANEDAAMATYEAIKAETLANSSAFKIHGITPGILRTTVRERSKKYKNQYGYKDNSASISFIEQEPIHIQAVINFSGSNGKSHNFKVNRIFSNDVLIDNNVLRQDLIAKYGKPVSEQKYNTYSVMTFQAFQGGNSADTKKEFSNSCRAEYVRRGGHRIEAHSLAVKATSMNRVNPQMIAELMQACPNSMPAYKKYAVSVLAPIMKVTLPNPRATSVLGYEVWFNGAKTFDSADRRIEQLQKQKIEDANKPKARL